MYVTVKLAFYESLKKLIGFIPSVSPLEIPDSAYEGLKSLFSLVGFLMPYNLYKPLFAFILALTAFRISWAIFITFKK